MKKKAFICAFVAVSAMMSCFTSCVSSQERIYLQNAERGKIEALAENYQTTIQKDDQLVITVSSKQPELTQPFMISALGGGGSGSSVGKDYQVDTKGNIVLPIIGTMKAAGKTCDQLAMDVAQALRRGEYISDASVNVRIANFKYSVLGEVGSPGIKTVAGERITVLEAIAQSGDLRDDANREITIMREQNGKRQLATLDLRSKDLFQSPFYYLQQNDVIYVTRSPHSFNMLRGDVTQWWGFGVGATGFILGLIALIAA